MEQTLMKSKGESPAFSMRDIVIDLIESIMLTDDELMAKSLT